MDRSYLTPQKKLETNALKTASKRAIQKMEKVTADLVRRKIEEKITKAAAKSAREDKKNPCKYGNQQAYIAKYKQHQESGTKLLMKFDFQKYKYKENALPE